MADSAMHRALTDLANEVAGIADALDSTNRQRGQELGAIAHRIAALRSSVSETSTRARPDPEVDFKGFVEAVTDDVMAEMEQHPEPEYWIAKSAARLARFVKVKAPGFIIEREKRLLASRIEKLPVYCADYDELNKGTEQ